MIRSLLVGLIADVSSPNLRLNVKTAVRAIRQIPAQKSMWRSSMTFELHLHNSNLASAHLQRPAEKVGGGKCPKTGHRICEVSARLPTGYAVLDVKLVGPWAIRAMPPPHYPPFSWVPATTRIGPETISRQSSWLHSLSLSLSRGGGIFRDLSELAQASVTCAAFKGRKENKQV